VSSAGVDLVVAAPGGPAKTAGDGLFATVEEVEESADFGEGERDETSTGGWGGFRFGGLSGPSVGPRV